MELKHKHLLVRAEVLDPPKDLKMMRKWTKNLIKDIDMKILAGPYAKYCDIKGNILMHTDTCIYRYSINIYIYMYIYVSIEYLY